MARLVQANVVAAIDKATKGTQLTAKEGNLLVEYIVFLELRLKLGELDIIALETLIQQKNLALYYESLSRTMGKEVADGLYSQAGLIRDNSANTPVAGEFTGDGTDHIHFEEDEEDLEDEDEDSLLGN